MMLRQLLWPLLALIWCSLAIAGCSREAPEEVESETVVPVTVAPAQTGSIRAAISATGVITPAPGADLVVVAPQAGRIAEMPKAEGDRVRRGDLLVRFEIPALTADAATRRAEVDRAEARLASARTAQARAHDLFDRGIAARKEVEEADRELAEAQAGLAEGRATLAAAETVAARAEVRATFDGIVAKRFHNPGDLVEAAAADWVLRIVDPRRLELTASIPIGDVTRVRVGAPAHLVSSGGTPLALKVASLPAAVEAGTASVPVRLTFAQPTALPVGTPLQVEIEAEAHTNVVTVPASAIVREGAETAVFVAAGDKAQRRPVVTGFAAGERVEVRSGLRAGEPVIVSGQAGLPDGAAITTASAEKTEPPEK